MVVTALVPDGVPARRAVRVMTDGWARLAEDPSLDRAKATAVRHMVARRWREHADPYAWARARGRLELLFGRAELLDELPGALDEVPTEAVATAAARLSTAPKGVLVLTPGNTRTRPSTRWPTPTEPPSTEPRPTAPHPIDTTPPNTTTPQPSQRIESQGIEGYTPEPAQYGHPARYRRSARGRPLSTGRAWTRPSRAAPGSSRWPTAAHPWSSCA
ncbi:hypothetical protein ACWHA3_12730 [Streptomyces cyaneofuscatus]